MSPRDPIVAIEPRALGECIDLAVLLCRRRLATIAALTILVGTIPTAVVVLRSPAGYGWLWAAGMFCFTSPVLGVVLVCGTGQHLFGEPLTVRRVFEAVRPIAAPLAFWCTLGRVVWVIAIGASLGLLAIPAGTSLGLLPEVMALEQVSATRAPSRCRQLLWVGFWEACGRWAGTAGFAVACGVSLFFAIDVVSQFMLQAPVFLGRVSSPTVFEDVIYLFSYDPLTLGVASASAWLSYPLGRLAWFFCYIDQRVRCESWDLELEVRAEALRIQHAI